MEVYFYVFSQKDAYIQVKEWCFVWSDCRTINAYIVQKKSFLKNGNHRMTER